MKKLTVILFVLLLASLATAFELPKSYLCHKTLTPIVVDGKLDEASWNVAPWTDPLQDIEGAIKPAPRYQTRAKMLWDDHALYIGAVMEEPNLWATILKRDSVIFRDNDFEVFIDPNGDNFEYAELEINAMNTQWDLFLPKPYKDDGHPNDAWNIDGIQSAVTLHGSLNNPGDKDSSWVLEIALPWVGLKECTHTTNPPHDGDQWRLNFSRVEWKLDTTGGAYQKMNGLSEDNWVWSPQHVVNMHRPETWGIVQFTNSQSDTVKITPDPFADDRILLHAVYYAETEYFQKHKEYAKNLSKLTLDPSITKAMKTKPVIELKKDGYSASLKSKTADGDYTIAIRQDSYFTITKSSTR
jgi:hypothetical protein